METVFGIATVQLTQRGRLGVSGLPGLRNNFSHDFKGFLDWKPSIVVSMTELDEMRECDAENLCDQLQRNGIDWLHLPVSDYGGLSASNAERWPSISSQLHQSLDAGNGVLIHCRGGHGRSGMIALRLMVESGERPELALKRLRSVRPGAVETTAQFEWATEVKA